MRKIARFFRSDKGSMSVQFVFCVPILMGLGALTAEFGKALDIKHVLERSVRDATRYISRAPQDSAGNFYQVDVEFARALVLQRLPVPDGKKTVIISTPQTVTPTDSTEELRTPFTMITVRAGVEVPTGLLRMLYFFNASSVQKDLQTINLAASEETRYYGD